MRLLIVILSVLFIDVWMRVFFHTQPRSRSSWTALRCAHVCLCVHDDLVPSRGAEGEVEPNAQAQRMKGRTGGGGHSQY